MRLDAEEEREDVLKRGAESERASRWEWGYGESRAELGVLGTRRCALWRGGGQDRSGAG